MEPLLSRVKGGVDFVSVMSLLAIVLVVLTLSISNTQARDILMLVSSVFVGVTITAFLFNSSMVLNLVMFTFVTAGTYSFMDNFLESTEVRLISSPQ